MAEEKVEKRNRNLQYQLNLHSVYPTEACPGVTVHQLKLNISYKKLYRRQRTSEPGTEDQTGQGQKTPDNEVKTMNKT